MRIRFLGIGGAFIPELGSSSAVVETGAGTLTLIDAGCSTYADLRRTGLIETVTDIVITHLHDDHVGSLGSIINHRYHVSGAPVRLHYPPWLREPLITLLTLQRTNHALENYVRLMDIGAPDVPNTHTIGRTRIEPVDTTDLHQKNMPSSAYIFHAADRVIGYSGDLADPDIMFRSLADYPKATTLVCHDVSFDEQSRASHVFYRELHKCVDAGWNIRGYHNDPRKKPADCRIPLVAEDPELAPQR